MKKVSVIIPVYNAEVYLSNCLESIVNQTYENIEILIINDGSTDSSFEICEKYKAKDARIKLFDIENSGVSTARNIGLNHATGEYITFVDSDDWADLNMLEFAVEKIQQDKSDIVIWSYYKTFREESFKLPMVTSENRVFIDDKSLLYYKSVDSMYGQKKNEQSVSAGTVWCKLYKSELIKEHQLQFNPLLTRAQDTVFSINAFRIANKITYYNEHLYHYRITSTSTSSGTRFISDTLTPFNALLDEFQMFIKYVEDKEQFTKVFNVRATKVLLWHLEHNYFHEKFKGNIFKRISSVSKLIKPDIYQSAIKNVEISELPKKERTMIKFFRYNRIMSFYCLYIVHAKLFKLKSQRF